MTLTAFLICELSALALGFLTALVFTRGERHSGAYAQTLALLPPVVALVIMMVNGNIGAGLGVAGTFALCVVASLLSRGPNLNKPRNAPKI